MACNDIIEVDQAGERFWIRKERVAEITGPNMNPMFVFQQHLPMIGKVYPALAQVMRIDGPLGNVFSACVRSYHTFCQVDV